MKTIGKDSPAAREPIVNKTKNTSETTKDKRQYCKNNRERINEYWRSYYAKNKEQIRQRLKRKVSQNIVRIGAWDQESEKLETSLVPSDTLWETPTVKT